MIGVAVKSEIRKLLSTRMWWILTLSMFAYLVFLGLAIAFSFSAIPDMAGTGPALSSLETAMSTYSITNPLGYAFPLVIGSLLFTNEFRHQTITSTLLVDPNRGRLVVAKLLVAGMLGVLLGVVAVAGTVLGAAPVLATVGDGAHLGSTKVISVLAWTAVVMAVWTVMGVAVGGLLKNQIAAIVVLIGVTQFIEPIARFAAVAVNALSGVAGYLPGAAADAVVGASFFGATGADVALLGRWQGLLVMVAYVAVFAAGARWITLRRDIV